MKHALLSIDVTKERDIAAARQRARQVGALLGFDPQDQVRIAAAVSELARNALRYANGGHIEFALDVPAMGEATLQIVVSDQGSGIGDIEAATSGTTSSGEPKLGLVTARRVMDHFDVESSRSRGTKLTLGKTLPRRAGPVFNARIAAIKQELAAHRTEDANAELQQQNRELLRSMEELTRLNAELEDTNRGVLALYAELDERATHLRLADETKTRFLSNISHELRTPLNSILALSKILLNRLDGDLSAEQDKQVRYICEAAEQLSTIVDDLLDLRKVESGKIQLRVETFTVTELFGALRGVFKPLAVKDEVALIFEEAPGVPVLNTDQGKVAQILRNLISNALKFTARGSVRVGAKLAQANPPVVVFWVADTGVGIAPQNHRRIFEEFTQVENPLQTAVKGTGLGLPLSQRLAGLLGGSIEIQSQLGEGSLFSVAIPARLEAMPAAAMQAGSGEIRAAVDRVLIVDDNEIERYALRQFLSAAHYEVIEASGGYDGLRLARQTHPDFIFLDLMMPDIHGFEVLKMLAASEETRSIPVVLFTSQRPADLDQEQVAAADALLVKSELSRESVAEVLQRVRATNEINHVNTH